MNIPYEKEHPSFHLNDQFPKSDVKLEQESNLDILVFNY